MGRHLFGMRQIVVWLTALFVSSSGLLTTTLLHAAEQADNAIIEEVVVISRKRAEGRTLTGRSNICHGLFRRKD